MTAKKKNDNTVTTTVFVRCGRVPEFSIYKTALEAVRDAIPIVYDLSKEITNVSDVKTVDGVEGRDYEVTFTYKPRKTTDDGEAVNLDKVVNSLTVPTQADFMALQAGGEGEPA